MRSSDAEDNPGPKTSRRSCRIVYANIRGLHRDLLHLSLIGRIGDVFFFCSEILASCRRYMSKLMVPGFGTPMQLLRGKVGRFREMAVYVPDEFLPDKQRGYECECCEVVVVKICSSSHIFYAFDI